MKQRPALLPVHPGAGPPALLPSLAGLHRPTGWDWALLPLVLAALVLLGFGATQMLQPYRVGDPLPLTLDPRWLPYYLLRTTLRMALAMLASLAFAGVFALLAAKSRSAERVLVPLLDILQSIPILGFLSITVTGFVALFPGSLLGVECAAIFAIFTSQAWNLAFSLYQSMRTVPPELDEAARMSQLSAWQRFWRLELPFAMPALLWNMMMSMSGGWFFVVVSRRSPSPARASSCPASARTSRRRSSCAISAPSAGRSPRWRWASCSTTSCCSGRWWPGRSAFASTRTPAGSPPAPGCSPGCGGRAACRR